VGQWARPRGENAFDGGSYFYEVYECADGGLVAVGALEPAFLAALESGLGIAPGNGRDHLDASTWSARKREFAEAFKKRTRDEWVSVFAGTDACVAPVLELDEVPEHPQLAERRTFEMVGGRLAPVRAIRFSRTAPAVPRPAVASGTDTGAILAELGIGSDEIARLRADGVVT
jgi:alpha-methylacyl-CoA racemase